MAILTLVKTCNACPEQYTVYDKDKKHVAYMRLRHGCFQARVGEKMVYKTEDFKGDGLFADDSERQIHLTMACHAILARLSGVGLRNEGLFEIVDASTWED